MSQFAHFASTKEIFLWRLSNAVLWSILLQVLFLWMYLCVIYINILHPLTWIKDTFVLLTNFSTWLRLIPCGCILFLQGVYCGKNYLQPQPTYSTRFSFFCHLFSLHNIFLCSLHMISGGLTVWLYLSMLGGHYTSLIRNCNEHGDSLCLMEGNLFLFLSGFWNGMIYFLKDHALAPAIVNFPPIQQAKFIQVKSSLGSLFKKAMKGSLLPILTFALFYYLKGSMFRNFLISLFGLQQSDDVISEFFYVKNLSVVFYSWLFSSLFLTTMYSMALLFNVYLTEHNYFPIEPREGLTTLTAALSNGPEILNKLAAQDLMIMAYKDKGRRSVVFSLSQPGGHPTNWTNLSNQCLQIINSYCNDLNAVIGEKTIEMNKSPQRPQITSPSFVKSPKLRNMAQPYPMSPQFNELSSGQQSETISSIVKNELKIFLNALSKKPGISYFFGEIPELKLKWVVLRGQTVARVAQGLSQLVAASINEDMYGVAQDDLSSIITSFLHLKQALDKLSKSGIANKKSLRQDLIVMQMLAELKSAVKRSIYKITITFNKYIKDIPLDKETLQGLQAFVAMREG